MLRYQTMTRVYISVMNKSSGNQRRLLSGLDTDFHNFSSESGRTICVRYNHTKCVLWFKTPGSIGVLGYCAISQTVLYFSSLWKPLFWSNRGNRIHFMLLVPLNTNRNESFIWNGEFCVILMKFLFPPTQLFINFKISLVWPCFN